MIVIYKHTATSAKKKIDKKYFATVGPPLIALLRVLDSGQQIVKEVIVGIIFTEFERKDRVNEKILRMISTFPKYTRIYGVQFNNRAKRI